MKINKRIWLFSGLVLLGMTAIIAYLRIERIVFSLPYPQNSFLFLGDDRFMDFFQVNSSVAQGNPYANGSSYPPLALAIAFLFSRIIPYTESANPFFIRDYIKEGVISLALLYTVCFIVLAIFICREVWAKINASRWIKLLLSGILTFSLAVSAPIIFSVDRGNYLIICVLFLVIFALNYGKNDYVSALFLALAACIKVYPLVFFFLFFRDKKWKPLWTGLFAGASVTILCAALFRGGLLRNLWRFFRSAFNFTGGFDPTSMYYYRYTVGLRNLIAAPFLAGSGKIPDSLPISAIYIVCVAALLGLVLFMCWKDRVLWRQVMYLTFFMILFMSPSYFYNLAYLIPPVLLLLLKKEHEKAEWLYISGFALLMISKNYIYFQYAFSDCAGWIGLDFYLDPIIMLLLLGISFFCYVVPVMKSTGHNLYQGKKEGV